MKNPKYGKLFYITDARDCREENLERKMTSSQLIDRMIERNLHVAAISTPSLDSDRETEEMFKSEGGIVESFESYRIFLMPGAETNKINKIKEFIGEKTVKDMKLSKIIEFLEELTTELEIIESAAVIDDMGNVLATTGIPKGMNEDDFRELILTLYITAKQEGKILKKGSIDEMFVIWEKGTFILKKINRNYFLQVITAEDANSAWIRVSIRAKLSETRKF